MFSFKYDEINVNTCKSKRNTNVVQMKKHPNKKTVKNTQKLVNDYFTVFMNMIEPPLKADIDDTVPILEAPVMLDNLQTPEKDDFTLDEDDWTPKNKTQRSQKKWTLVSFISGSDDEDYSYNYSSEVEVKIPVVRKSGDVKRKAQLSCYRLWLKFSTEKHRIFHRKDLDRQQWEQRVRCKRSRFQAVVNYTATKNSNEITNY